MSGNEKVNSEEVWSDQDEQQLKALRRRKARFLRDKTRQRKYSPRLSSSLSENQTTGDKK